MFNVEKYQKRNDKGELIEHEYVFNDVAQLIVAEYKIGVANPEFWDKGSIYHIGESVADRQGFDIRAKRLDKQKYIIELEKGKYPLCYKYRVTVSQQYLGKGAELVRYGSERGHFTALSGTEFNKLGLPYVQDSVEFHRYKVLKNIPVMCFEVIDDKEQQRILDIKDGKEQPKVQYAVEGITAPAFGTLGGAIQYYHDICIMEMLGTILEKIE
ncbi:MAG: TNT domain-containing protein [Roseburia sp.]|nr:TNT domain-containing protein [Roseburia sp.]